MVPSNKSDLKVATSAFVLSCISFLCGLAIQGYLSQLPVSAFPYLNLQLDWDNEYDYDLIEITKHLLNWEILLVTPFKFTPADIRDIKTANQSSPELQRYIVI